MIGKIIGAVVGARAAQHTRSVDGPGGAILGAAAVGLARRFGPLGWIAAAAGGYALKRYSERRAAGQPAGSSPWPADSGAQGPGTFRHRA